MNKILFTVGFGTVMEDFLVYLDTFLPIKATEDEWNIVLNFDAAEELAIVPKELEEMRMAVISFLNIIPMRLRFNQDMYQHICVISLPDDVEMTREGLEIFLNTKTKEELKTFLKGASIET